MSTEEWMCRAYPNDPVLIAKIKTALEGVAVYSDIATFHSQMAEERDDSDAHYRTATKYFAMRTENMESIHTQLDELASRCERLRAAMVYLRDTHVAGFPNRMLYPSDLVDDLKAQKGLVQ